MLMLLKLIALENARCLLLSRLTFSSFVGCEGRKTGLWYLKIVQYTEGVVEIFIRDLAARGFDYAMPHTSGSHAAAMCPVSIEKFNPDKMMLSPWLELFDQLCKYLNIPAEPVGSDGKGMEAPNKRRQLFLLHLDFKVYQKLHFYCLPAKLEAKPIPELCKLLQQEYEAPYMRECNNALFHSRRQGLKESNKHFVEAVQELGMRASLENDWSDQVAERLLYGVKSDKVRQHVVAQLSGYPKPKQHEKLQIVKQTLLLEDAIEAVMKIPRN